MLEPVFQVLAALAATGASSRLTSEAALCSRPVTCQASRGIRGKLCPSRPRYLWRGRRVRLHWEPTPWAQSCPAPSRVGSGLRGISTARDAGLGQDIDVEIARVVLRVLTENPLHHFDVRCRAASSPRCGGSRAAGSAAGLWGRKTDATAVAGSRGQRPKTRRHRRPNRQKRRVVWHSDQYEKWEW